MNHSVSDSKSAEHYTWGGVCDGWHLLKDPALSVIQERVPTLAGETPHFHVRARQFFYVLSGTATMEFESGSVTFGAGQGPYVPPHTPHRGEHSDQAGASRTGGRRSVTAVPPQTRARHAVILRAWRKLLDPATTMPPRCRISAARLPSSRWPSSRNWWW